MKTENQATPRPWTYEERCSGIVITDGKDEETIIASFIPRSEEDEDECTDEQEANAELIVKAVNAYDSLVEEVRRLKSDTEERIEAASLSNKDKRYLADRIIELQNENQKLREALKEIREHKYVRESVLIKNFIDSLLKAKNV